MNFILYLMNMNVNVSSRCQVSFTVSLNAFLRNVCELYSLSHFILFMVLFVLKELRISYPTVVI